MLYWCVVYVLFRLRSIVEPSGHFLASAGLSAIMMVVGFALTLTLLRILGRLDLRAWPRRLATYALLGLLADVVYVLTNYVVFYVVPGLWEPEHGPIAKIGSYIVEGFWLFPAWLVLCEAMLRRYRPDPPAADAPRVSGLWIGTRGQQVRIPFEEVEWVEAEGDYVRIHTGDRSHLHRSTMAKMERALDPGRFVRIHRGIIAAAPLLASVRRGPDGRMTVTLVNGRELPVGRSYVGRVRELVRPVGTADAES